MVNSVTASTPETQTPQQPSGTDGINKEAFLKLLTAQLQNQDPLAPADGTQFVSQLAGFAQLEQTIAMKQDLAAIREALARNAAGQATTTGQAPASSSNIQGA